MKNIMKNCLLGFLVGIVNGLFGSGGGTLLVPSLQRFFHVACRKAHATAIAIILPLSVLSAFIYVKNTHLHWDIVLYVSIGGLVGGYVGAHLLNKLSVPLLRKAFGIFIMISAARMLL